MYIDTGAARAAVIAENNRTFFLVFSILAEIRIGEDRGNRLSFLVVEDIILADRMVWNFCSMQGNHMIGFESLRSEIILPEAFGIQHHSSSLYGDNSTPFPFREVR